MEQLFRKAIHDRRFSFREVAEKCKYNPHKIGAFFERVSIERRIATVYGNCQSFFISRMMQDTDVFSNYIFCEFPWVHKMNAKDYFFFALSRSRFRLSLARSMSRLRLSMRRS